MDLDWRDEKSDECLRDRGFDFAFASRLFDGEVIAFHDNREEYGERRMVAFGQIDGLDYAVVYTDRADVRWIISAFRVRAKELKRWQRRDAADRSGQAG